MTRTGQGPSTRTDHVSPVAPGVVARAVPLPAPSLNGDGAHPRETPAAGERTQTTRIVKTVVEEAAHDMSNLLLIIDANLALLEDEWLSRAGADAVGSLRAQLSLMRWLARELRMAGAEEGPSAEEARTALAVWWPEMDVLLRAVHGTGVTVRADIPASLPGVCITSHHLSRVVLNLVGNAVHAIAERAAGEGGPGAEDGLATAGRGEVEVSARLAGDGRAVTIMVADNGAGMSPAVLVRAREPSFTTRAGVGGTGLGLAIVERLVSQAGGRVHLFSAVGAGTKVIIELRTGEERASEGATGASAGPVRWSGSPGGALGSDAAEGRSGDAPH